MPTYDYVCRACEHRFEHFQSMSDPLLRKCPRCKRSKLERLIGAGAGILFKGSGFYETDYKRKSPPGDSKASGKSGDGESGGGPDKGSSQGDSKADSKGDNKGNGRSDGHRDAKSDAGGQGEGRRSGKSPDSSPSSKDAAGKPAPSGGAPSRDAPKSPPGGKAKPTRKET
jgi:putative FmdB family regulatory protein